MLTTCAVYIPFFRLIARMFEINPFEPWTTRDKVDRVSLGVETSVWGDAGQRAAAMDKLLSLCACLDHCCAPVCLLFLLTKARPSETHSCCSIIYSMTISGLFFFNLCCVIPISIRMCPTFCSLPYYRPDSFFLHIPLATFLFVCIP
jgi:hypothetical protein